MIQVNHYVGLPYEQANCWELVRRVYRETYDIQLPKLDTVGAVIEQGGWLQVAKGAEIDGDVLVFKAGAAKTHVGIVVDPKEKLMLHAEEGVDACVARYNSSIWKSRLRSIYRHRHRL